MEASYKQAQKNVEKAESIRDEILEAFGDIPAFSGWVLGAKKSLNSIVAHQKNLLAKAPQEEAKAATKSASDE